MAGYAVTELDGHGRTQPVHILNIGTDRKPVDEVVRIAQAHDKQVFITVEEGRASRGGYFRRTPGVLSLLGRRR